MLNLAFKLEDEVTCLVDGNASSFAMAHFIAQKRKVNLLALVNPTSDKVEDLLHLIGDFATRQNLILTIGYYNNQEEYDAIIKQQSHPVCLPMDLDQVIEFYIDKLVKGVPSFPVFKTDSFILPWILNERQECEDYCFEKDIDFDVFYAFPKEDLLEAVVGSLCDYEDKFMKIMKGRVLNRVKRSQKQGAL